MKIKKSKFFILFLLVFSLFSINTKIFAEPTTLNENDFKIMGVAQQSENNIKLDWTELKNANYQIYQSVDGQEFQTMSTFDTESGTDKVRVLQIYPISNAANQLKTWLVTNGYGKGIMEVDSVYMDNFNANPNNYLKNSDGTWKYDVIFFGTWDCNNKKDLNETSYQATKTFIEAGKGVIFGHDTINYSPCPNFTRLNSYAGITASSNCYSGNSSAPYGAGTGNSTVKIAKKGLFTTYPWDIGEVGTILTIPASHNSQQAIYKDNIWLRFYLPSYSDTEMNDGNNFYLATQNNVAMIQTGHSSGNATVDEQKILANLIFYTDQITEETSYVDHSGQDFALPNKPIIKIDANNGKLLMETTDNGSIYQYKAKAYVDGQTLESEPISVENKSGIKGFYYLINTKPIDIVMNANGTFVENSIDLNTLPIALADTNYLHIAAVDNANNVSETTTLSMDDIIGINASNIAYTINTTDDTTNVDLSIVASGVNVNYQWEMRTENGEWEEIDAATLKDYSMDITNMNELLYYRCKVYNNSLFMYSNEVIVNPTTYDKTYVYVTQASTFSVKIPKVMILSGQTGKGEYVVSINGNVSGLASINVIPNDFAIMKDVANVKTSFNAIVTQDKTSFDANEIINGTTINGLVDGSKYMTAGSWKGNFNFAIDFEDEKAKVNSIASVNQNDDGTIVGYDKEQEQSTAYSHISFIN